MSGAKLNAKPKLILLLLGKAQLRIKAGRTKSLTSCQLSLLIAGQLGTWVE